ncbi:unnamed protein product [Ectocarpus sp. CCAP 1310/34]|nr:unnamed protein product [Ectocarpus sp. CCAP 1310/34]
MHVPPVFKEASTSHIKAAERPCIAARNSTDSDQQSHLVRVQEGAHSPCSSPPYREDPHDESGAVKGGNDRVQLFPAYYRACAKLQRKGGSAPYYTMAQPDREALVALYNATGGAKWENKRNWNTRAALSQWYGVEVDSQGRVVTLSLAGNNLQGTIPPELGQLTALQFLHLYENQLIGPIPKELGALSGLQALDLHLNQLSGHIPRQLGDLGALETLNLRYNKLEGPIPEELGKLTALETLDLERNNLSGSIPPELGELAALHLLNLSLNQLTGEFVQQFMF